MQPVNSNLKSKEPISTSHDRQHKQAFIFHRYNISFNKVEPQAEFIFVAYSTIQSHLPASDATSHWRSNLQIILAAILNSPPTFKLIHNHHIMRLLRPTPRLSSIFSSKAATSTFRFFTAMAPHNDVGAFHEALRSSKRILALCGAGLSASSGLPTFRGAGGLWRNHDATSLATMSAFKNDPGLVWLFYNYRRHMCLRAEPNPAHYALAALAEKNKDFLCLTQNVDSMYFPLFITS